MNVSATNIRKYIREQPQKPSGVQNRTPILVSDSKGFTLRNYCPNLLFPFELWCIPGARTTKLTDLIRDRTDKAIVRHGKIAIYIWSGTCDLTVKDGESTSIRLRNKDNRTIDNIVSELKSLIRFLDRYGSNVVLRIVDCPVLSITSWNKQHLHKKELSTKDIAKYKLEDLKLTEQISKLNKRIWYLNYKLGYEPIKTSQFYFRTRGGRRKHSLIHSVRTTLNKKDGVHPGKVISLVFTKLLLIDSYKECFISIPSEEILQLLVEEEELLSLKL